MKKLILSTFLICTMLGVNATVNAATSTSATPAKKPAQTEKDSNNAIIKAAIQKFKNKNYLECIQDLEPIAKKDPSNATVHYYLGSSYMNIGDRNAALESFQKVADLNTVPTLTSYAIQASQCIQDDNILKCTYKKLDMDQIGELIKNPTGFLQELQDKELQIDAGLLELPKVNNEEEEIEKLIKGKYKNNIHPEASKTLINTQIEKERGEVNAAPVNRSDIPTDEEIANAVKILARAGLNMNTQNFAQKYNSQHGDLAMLYSNNNNQDNNFMNMLPFIMSQESGNKQMSPELIQAMMMSQMMPDFNFDTPQK